VKATTTTTPVVTAAPTTAHVTTVAPVPGQAAPPPPPAGQQSASAPLPKTGAVTEPIVWIAAIVLGTGGFFLLVSRKPRRG
jgi:LPXTG-motif cell wall-anchored protein